jgi:hypothetical protein
MSLWCFNSDSRIPKWNKPLFYLNEKSLLFHGRTKSLHAQEQVGLLAGWLNTEYVENLTGKPRMPSENAFRMQWQEN